MSSMASVELSGYQWLVDINWRNVSRVGELMQEPIEISHEEYLSD